MIFLQNCDRLTKFLLIAGTSLAVSVAMTAVGASAAPNSKGNKRKSVASQSVAKKLTWPVNCSSAGVQSKLACKMTHTLFVTKTRKRVLQISVSSPIKKAGRPTMLLALPHGLYLPAGVILAIDKKAPKKFLIQSADQNGSYAGLVLDAATVKSLRSGAKLTVSLMSVKRQKFNLEVSLAGFAASYDQITRQK